MATGILLAALAPRLCADAIVTSKAAQAETIVELFIESNQVRVEIEVGRDEQAPFASLIGAAPGSLSNRQTADAAPEVSCTPWQLSTEEGPLAAEVVSLVEGQRIHRDERTGQPLIPQPGDAEPVLRLTLKYPLMGQPRALTIRPPLVDGQVTNSMGFMCYHRSVPVNDFRYLPREATVDLDWQDPWFSRFRNRNLRRQFEAPLSAFLYVDSFEVRKEIVVRPRDLQTWLPLGLEGTETISVATQEAMKAQVADFLLTRSPVEIDGQQVSGQLDRIHFIQRSLAGTGIIEPAVDLPTVSATLGVIMVYPIDQLPEQVTLRWDLFTPKIQLVPAVATDDAGGVPAQLTPQDPMLTWKNYLSGPTVPQFREIETPLPRTDFSVPVLSCLCMGIAIYGGVRLAKRPAGSAGLCLVVCAAIVGALVSLPFARVGLPHPQGPPRLEAVAATEVITGLLHNTYRAFDHHNESLIYDRLAESISGDLLQDVYLETRKHMQVKNQGGLQISVRDVEVADLQLEQQVGADSTFLCQWRVDGSMGHWGHVHERENQHTARITIGPRDQRWKITALEMWDEQSANEAPRGEST